MAFPGRCFASVASDFHIHSLHFDFTQLNPFTLLKTDSSSKARAGVLHTRDPGPIEEGCTCHACATFSRAYLRHLVKAEEILGLRLITLHNLHFYLSLRRKIRTAILDGSFAEFRREFVSGYRVWNATGKEEF